MKILNWRGMHGYGDFVPPFTFAFNECVRLKEDVHLIFHFVTPQRKFKPQDENTYEEIIEFVYNNMDTTDLEYRVTWEARYNIPYEYIPEPMHSNSIDAMYGIHNYRTCNEKYRWKGTNETEVAIVSTLKHAEKFRDIQYRNSRPGIKNWKDPWPDDWQEFSDKFERLGFTVRHVHYEMSVKEIAEIIRDCGIVYSYHAGAAWLARWQGAPMVVCSDKKHFTEFIFPWSVWYDKSSFDMIPFNLFDDLETSLERKDKYMFNAELYKYAVPGTHVWQNLCPHYHLRAFPFGSHATQNVWKKWVEDENKELEKILR